MKILTPFQRKMQRLRNWLYEVTDGKVLGAALLFMISLEIFFISLTLP